MISRVGRSFADLTDRTLDLLDYFDELAIYERTSIVPGEMQEVR